MEDLPVRDIQSLIVKSHKMPCLRVFPLTFKRARRAAAATFLRGLVSGGSGAVHITNGEASGNGEYCLNMGFTYKGLEAMGLPADPSLNSFPVEFRAGARGRAEIVGDTGASDPGVWDPAFKDHDNLHALLLLYTREETLESTTSKIRNAMAGGFSEVSELYTSSKLADNGVHFGYRDGIAQPTIKGVPRLLRGGAVDPLPPVEPGAFVLGYQSQFRDLIHPVPQPEKLGKNGSFLAFRLLHQNCDAFEDFLENARRRTGLSRDQIAAQLCGRWPDGTPLSRSSAQGPGNVPEREWNNFDYADDPDGVRCPVGSHIRRMNPRRSEVAGATGLKRRIIRRGLPFGEKHVQGDGKDRGLLGVFICASLKEQFEFVMSEWTNRGAFAAGLSGTKDPIHGNNSGGSFEFDTDGGPQRLSGLAQFVTCKGAAYCLLPSLPAIDYLADVAANGHG